MFYDRLKQVCTSQGKSPSSVAQAIGMSKANVTGWKNGASPKILTVARLGGDGIEIKTWTIAESKGRWLCRWWRSVWL